MAMLVKLIGIFALMVVMLQKKVKLGYVMLIAALVISIIFNIGIKNTIKVAFYTIIDKDTIKLIILLVLIMNLEKVMSNRRLMSKMVISLKNVVGDYKIASLILPAIIGFLPSAGGAVFSAPMIEEVCSGIIVENDNKSFINFWYRHVWEYVFPVYSALILASAILDVTIEKLVSFFYPYTILNIIIGIPIAYHYFPKGVKDRPRDICKNLVKFISNSYPITLILVLFFILKIDIVITVLIALFSLLAVEKIDILEFWDIIKKDNSLTIIVTVIGIIYFKNMFVESAVIEKMPFIFYSMGIDDVYVALFLPLVIGILTGMMSAVVGITFPIVMNLSGNLDFNLITLAYVSGAAGMMMSPMHLCFTLTIEYFKADFNKVLIRVAIGQTFIIACAVFDYLIFA
ncbi:MAG: hypothetical protein HPY66_3062 [Firmicutes bacterium]|nr:hypothetical protein [Bacillota bacterium]